MSMETWGSQEGQGATWMYCSDMMELELIMDVDEVCGGFRRGERVRAREDIITG